MLALTGAREATGSQPAGVGRWVDRLVAALERDRTSWVVLGVAMAAYAALAMWLTRGITLFVDSYLLFTGNHGLDPAALLHPLNGHLVLVERAVHALAYELFGADFVVLRLVEVGGALLATGLVFEYARRRLGAPLALAGALLLLTLGSAWEATLLVDGQTNVYSAAFGVAALLALDRRSRRGDVLCCLFLALSIAAWTLGLAFAVIAGVLIWSASSWRRRIWVVGIPLVLYAAWFVWARTHLTEPGQHVALSNALLIPNFIVDELAAVAAAGAGLNHAFDPQDIFGGVFATTLTLGTALAALGAAGLVVRARRDPHPALWAVLAGLAAFWIALAMGFGAGRSPMTARYVYPGLVLVLLVAAEACRRLRPSRTAIGVVLALVALAACTNLFRLQEGAGYLRDFSTELRAQLAAIEVARAQVDPAFVPAKGPANFDIVTAGPYLAAVDRNGSPAYSAAAMAAQPEHPRAAADATLVEAERIGPEGAPEQGRPLDCRVIHPPAPGGAATLSAEPGTDVVLRSRTSAPVAVRRFGLLLTTPVGTLSPGRPARLAFPADGYDGPWHVSVGPAKGPVSLCEGGG